MVALAGQLDVPGIDINAQVLSMSEVRNVGAGATPDVQYGTDFVNLVMFQKTGKLLAAEWQLREVEQERLFEEIVKDCHGRQYTVNLPIFRDSGNPAETNGCSVFSCSIENSGLSLMTAILMKPRRLIIPR